MEEVSFDDFQKLDMRIGTVIEADIPEWSHWVIRLKVDFGPDIGTRTIFSGLMGYYEPGDLLGKQFPFLINIKPKKIGPEDESGERQVSEGMLLAASVGAGSAKEEDEEPVLLCVSKSVPNGTKIR